MNTLGVGDAGRSAEWEHVLVQGAPIFTALAGADVLEVCINGPGCLWIETRNGWLVPSGTRNNVIHRVSTDMWCSCEAGQAHRGCWHIEAVKLMSMQEAA